jgi:hypothetical protein
MKGLRPPLLSYLIGFLGIFAFLQFSGGLEARQQSPTSFEFKWADLGPWAGRLDPQESLILTQKNSRWELISQRTRLNLSNEALRDLELVSFRDQSRNPILLGDWLMAWDSTKVRSLTPRRGVDFARAWNEWRIQWAGDRMNLEKKLRSQNFQTAGEIYLGMSMADRLAETLKSSSFKSQVQDSLAKAFESLPQEFIYNLSHEFLYSTDSAEVSAHLEGQASVQVLGDLSQTEIIFDSSTTSDPAHWMEKPMGTFTIKVPLRGLVIGLQNLTVRSPLIQQAFALPSNDAISLQVGWPEGSTFDLSLSVLWNKVLQQPQLVFEADRLKTPLHTMKLEKLIWGGREIDVSSASLADLALTDLALPLAAHIFDHAPWAHALLQGQIREWEKALLEELPFEETFVVLANEKGLPSQFEIFSPVRADHSPDLNPRVLARFRLQIPIEVSLPKLDVGISVSESALRTQIELKIKNPDIEMKDLEVFQRGRRLMTNGLGLQFYLTNFQAAETELKADAGLSIGNEVQFRLDDLETNLAGLSLSRVQLKMGEHLISTQRPGLSTLIENIFAFRSLVFSPQAQATWVRQLQFFIQESIRRETYSRLRNKIFSLGKTSKINGQKDLRDELPARLRRMSPKMPLKWSYQGDLKVDSLPLSDLQIEFKDRSGSDLSCQGTYLFSTFLNVGLTERMSFTATDSELSLLALGQETQVQLPSFSVALNPKGSVGFNSHLDFCLSANQQELDVGVSDFEVSAEDLILEEPRLEGLQLQSRSLEKIFSVLRLKKGPARDRWVAQQIKKVMDDNKSQLLNQVREALMEYFLTTLNSTLESAYVKDKVQGEVMRLRQWEDQAATIMFQLGHFLNDRLAQHQAVKSTGPISPNPLEELIAVNLVRLVNERIEAINPLIQEKKNIVDTMLVNLGSWLADDIESLLVTQALKAVHGGRSVPYAMTQLHRILSTPRALEHWVLALGGKPLPLDRAQEDLVRSLEKLVMDPAGCEMSWSAQVTDRVQAESLMALQTDFCFSNEQTFWSQQWGQLIPSLNGLLLRETLLKWTSHAPWEWVRDENSQNPIFQPELSQLNYVESDGAEAMRARVQVAGILNPAAIETQAMPEFVREQLLEQPDRVVIRLLRTTINQFLLKIDWEQSLRAAAGNLMKPDDRVVIDQVPRLRVGRDGQLLLDASIKVISRDGKVRLVSEAVLAMIQAVFSGQDLESTPLQFSSAVLSELKKVSAQDVAGFTLSFFDLSNPFGFDLQLGVHSSFDFRLARQSDGTYRSMIEVHDLQAQVEGSRFVEQAWKRRERNVKTLLDEILDQLTRAVPQVPGFDALGQTLVLESVQPVNGDLYVVGRSIAVP